MGCTESRQVTSAEKYMRKWETECSFAQVEGREADIGLRRYALDWKLTPDQLTKIASDLGFSLKNNKAAQHRHFIRSFQQAGFYSAQEMLVALVLLGKGLQTVKLELLFEIFEKQSANLISAPTIRRMASVMLKVAILKAPLLIPSSNLAMAAEVSNYLNTLKIGLSKATSALAEALLDRRTTLTLEEFKVTAANVRMADVTTCGGLRDFAISASLRQRK